MIAWDDRIPDQEPPAVPPSWGSVLGFVVIVAIVLAVFADIWLPALDQSMQWLDAPRPAAERMTDR
ncbi:MAG: hypothetical protein AB7R67_20190 [Vicinamibacterales bacterium]